jgi:excisionase family DNA binding protein
VFYTYKQIAALLRVSLATVEQMVRDGRLPKPLKLGPSVQSPARFPKTEIDAVIAEMFARREVASHQ